MLFENKGKIYLKIDYEYVEVKVKKRISGEYDIIPTKNRIHKDKMKNVKSITVAKAYEMSNFSLRNEENLDKK